MVAIDFLLRFKIGEIQCASCSWSVSNTIVASRCVNALKQAAGESRNNHKAIDMLWKRSC